jgi:hypothetical protein
MCFTEMLFLWSGAPFNFVHFVVLSYFRLTNASYRFNDKLLI